MPTQCNSVVLSIAGEQDRESIYAIRHQVYAEELGQHTVSTAGSLRDRLDEVNTYLVAKRGAAVVGFVSITPPGPHGYSIDKYFPRQGLALTFDEGLYEVRLLTVVRPSRRTDLALLLMYGALRYLESCGAKTVVGIGRIEVSGLYARAGLQRLGPRATAGAVTYDLMAAEVGTLRACAKSLEGVLNRLERSIDWQVTGVPFRAPAPCFHGGAFFEAVGDEFDSLERREQVINADVLDAWFEPAPRVVDLLARHLAFALKTSPPTQCHGMRRAIARERRVAENSVLPGAGSSDLIFAGLQRWVTPRSRVLILDPMYGEYAHILSHVIGARVERFSLCRAQEYHVDCEALAAQVSRRPDWVVLVNPNSPTGRHVPRPDLENMILGAPRSTRFWIDETYVDYVGEDQSLEAFASRSTNVIVCKSMSKVYALSGVRAAYLCGPTHLLEELQTSCPPWSVSLPGQMAACEALKALDYYRARWRETHVLRDELHLRLEQLGWEVVPGCANFLLCHLPKGGPNAALIITRAREKGVFLRDVSSMGTRMDDRTLRVAVKDRPTNQRIVQTLETMLREIDYDTGVPDQKWGAWT